MRGELLSSKFALHIFTNLDGSSSDKWLYAAISLGSNSTQFSTRHALVDAATWLVNEGLILEELLLGFLTGSPHSKLAFEFYYFV